MSKALILAGTNKPPCAEHLEKAESLLKAKGILVIKSSSLYKSPPWGFESEHDFINRALILESNYSPFELMRLLLETEKEMGRSRTTGQRYEDRIIDLDILLYQKEVIDSETLTIPHPRMELRRFALVPSAEIAGNWVHPVYRTTISRLLENCKDESVVSLVK
jgi:2-amino-4-hydroxy-6-hydroxymethyldihydropteridine diphosphokinase